MDDTMGNLKFVQLEPSAFLTDIDFQMMDAEQRGVYCSIIFYLYCNSGKIELDDNSVTTLIQTQTSKLAIISGCQKTGSEWGALWGKIADKFKITGNILTHKRVTEEIERAENFIKAKSDAGKKGMKTRWGDNTDITKVSKVKESKVKESKDKYKDCVFLTKIEYEKLVEKFGKTVADDWIATLDEGIAIHGYKYKSHYRVILKWSKGEQKQKPKRKSVAEQCAEEEVRQKNALL